MTGVGLLTRFFLGQSPDDEPKMKKHGDVMLRRLPKWKKGTKDFAECDMYYWYYATYAMYQLGGEHWKKWKGAMEDAIVKNIRPSGDGDYAGSWDPVGPWGYQGGTRLLDRDNGVDPRGLLPLLETFGRAANAARYRIQSPVRLGERGFFLCGRGRPPVPHQRAHDIPKRSESHIAVN